MVIGLPAPPDRAQLGRTLRDDAQPKTATAGAPPPGPNIMMPAYIGRAADTVAAPPPLKAPPLTAPPLRSTPLIPPPLKAAPVPAKKPPPPPPRSDDEVFTATSLHKAQATATRGREATMKSPPPCTVPRKSLTAALGRASGSTALAFTTAPTRGPTSSERRRLQDPKGRGSFSESVRGPRSRNSSPTSSATRVARALCDTHTRRVAQDQAGVELA